MSGGQSVLVHQNFLGSAQGTFLAAVDRVLLSLHRAHVVEVIAAPHRDVLVGLLDAANQFVIELLLEPFCALENRFGIHILRFEVFQNFRVFAGVVPKPKVVIDAGVAVDLNLLRDDLRDRRFGSGNKGAHENEGERKLHNLHGSNGENIARSSDWTLEVSGFTLEACRR